MPLVEELESRVLFAASPSPAVATDRQALASATDRARQDKAAAKTSLAADRAAIREAQLAQRADVAAAIAAFKTESSRCRTLLADDRAQQRTLLKSDQQAIAADQKAARSADATEAAAAAARLVQDQQKLEEDTQASAAKVAADTALCNANLAARKAAVETARRESAGLAEAKLKLINDAAQWKATFSADAQNVRSARVTLAKDIREAGKGGPGTPPPVPNPPPPPPVADPSSTIWVSPNGSDQGTGTVSSPLRTVAAAASVAQAGAVINFAPGTYNVSLALTNSGSAAKHIVMQAQPGTVTFDGGGNAIILDASQTRFVDFVGITFANASDGGAGNDKAAVRMGSDSTMTDCVVRDCGGGGLASLNDQNVTLKRVKALNNGRYGIGGTLSRNLLVQDCEIAGNNFKVRDPNGGGGKFTRVDGATFVNTEWHDNAGIGVWFDAYNINVSMSRCSIHDQQTKESMTGDGLWFEISGRTGNEGHPFKKGAKNGPLLLENSNVSNNAGDGVLIYSSFNVTVRDNLFSDDTVVFKTGGRAPFTNENDSVTGNQFHNGGVTLDSGSSDKVKAGKVTISGNTTA